MRGAAARIFPAIGLALALGAGSNDPPNRVDEPAGPIELQDALAFALMGNPELAAFSWERRSREARELQAGAIPNPSLDLRFQDRGIPRGNNTVDDEEARRRVMLSQVFEIGGKRRRRVDVARSETELAAWDYEAKRVEVAADVARRFATVLGGQRHVASLSSAVEYFERQRDRIAALVETGAMRRLELLRATRQAGLVRIDLQRAETDLAAARFRLAAGWGSVTPRFTRAVGDLERIRPVPSIETVLERARLGPALARWDAELKRREALIRLARSQRIPDVDYGVGLRWENDIDARDYILDLEVSLPIFDRKKGEILEARHDLEKAKAQREAAEAAVTAEIAELYFEIQEATGRAATLAADVIPAARMAFEAQQAGFENRAQNVGALFDARRDLTRAEVRRTEALVDHHRALAALESLVGQSLSAP